MPSLNSVRDIIRWALLLYLLVLTFLTSLRVSSRTEGVGEEGGRSREGGREHYRERRKGKGGREGILQGGK